MNSALAVATNTARSQTRRRHVDPFEATNAVVGDENPRRGNPSVQRHPSINTDRTQGYSSAVKAPCPHSRLSVRADLKVYAIVVPGLELASRGVQALRGLAAAEQIALCGTGKSGCAHVEAPVVEVT